MPRLAARLIVLALLVPLSASDARAQTWYTWDGSSAGTPPDVVLDAPTTPDKDHTTFTITVHGFYLEDVVEQSGIYQRVIIPSPGSGAIATLGDVEATPRLA